MRERFEAACIELVLAIEAAEPITCTLRESLIAESGNPGVYLDRLRAAVARRTRLVYRRLLSYQEICGVRFTIGAEGFCSGEIVYWLIVPFGATVNPKPGSSPFPGVVVFWASRTLFANTFRVTAPVGFSSHAFWSLIRSDTRVLTGTSMNVIS